MRLIDQLCWWRLNRSSKKLINSGITVASEFPQLIDVRCTNHPDRVATAVNIGNEPALIVGFRPVVMGSKMTCDRLYQLNWTTDGLPVYLAKRLRQVP